MSAGVTVITGAAIGLIGIRTSSRGRIAGSGIVTLIKNIANNGDPLGTFPGLTGFVAIAGVPIGTRGAIGGIDMTNVEQVLDAGATRVAVVRAVAGAADIAAAARALKQRLMHCVRV